MFPVSAKTCDVHLVVSRFQRLAINLSLYAWPRDVDGKERRVSCRNAAVHRLRCESVAGEASMASTCFFRLSLPLPLFPLLTRNVPMVAIHSFAPCRSMHRRLLSSAMIPRPNHLSCIRSMSSNASAEEAGVPRSVPVAVAHELLKAGHRYLDVRTEGEFSSGHAVGAVNIPYMFKSNSGMSKNPNFMQEVLSTFKKDDEIIVGCLSGKRSSMAATELSNAGFTGITDISGGYSAWVENGLPTEK